MKVVFEVFSSLNFCSLIVKKVVQKAEKEKGEIEKNIIYVGQKMSKKTYQNT